MRRSTHLHLLTLAAVASALAAASCVAPGRGPSPPLPAPRVESPAETESGIAERVLAAHNASRAGAGLPPCSLDPMLSRAAEGHARDMANRRRMTHRGGDFSSPFDRISRQGYTYRAAAENVAYGFDDVESVMVGWMKSPGHRRNILGPYPEIGVGRAIAKDGASYWCVTFGTPRPSGNAGLRRDVGYTSNRVILAPRSGSRARRKGSTDPCVDFSGHWPPC